jgi:chromosome segregation ATPase
MKRFLCSLSLAWPLLMGCTERLMPANLGVQQQAAQTARLRLVCVLQSPLADVENVLLKKLSLVRFELRAEGGSLKTEQISFDDTHKASAELNQTLQQVPSGALELKISLLDAAGQALQEPLVQKLRTVAETESVVRIALYGAQAQVLEVVNPSSLQQLNTLWQEDLRLRQELQTLGGQQSTLLLQARTLLKSQAPEDRIQLEQLRNELETLSRRTEPLQTRLKQIEAEMKALEAQTTARDMVQLVRLLQRSESLRREVGALLERRTELLGQSRVFLNQGQSAQENLNQAQTELQTVSETLASRQQALEDTVMQLEKLQVQVTAARAETLSKAEVQNRLDLLKSAIEQLQTHETELKQLIAALVEKTDLRNVTRREGYELELKTLQTRLAELLAQRETLQKRLDSAT